jgi:aminoglycoside phosphotransferase (APT) family kinase protein
MTNATQVSKRSRDLAESILADHGDKLPGNHQPCSWAWNDVWIRPKTVLRIANTDYTGLAIEALLSPEIPNSVGHPTVIDSGKTKGRCWILQKRVPGKPLGALWDGLPAAEAHQALGDLTARLGALHQVSSLPAVIENREPTCYVIDPAHANEVIAKLRARQCIDAVLGNSLRGIYRDFFAALAGQPMGVVHGDLHLYNAMYDPAKKTISGVIDFEDCGYGPIELDYYMLAKAVAEAHQLRSTEWLRSLLADQLGRDGAIERWTGYAIARLLGRTIWDPEVDVDAVGNEMALAALAGDLGDVVRGHHVGAQLLR